MSHCIPARVARVRLRQRRAPHKVLVASLVFPARWEKRTLLRYVRAEHPNETVVLLDWPPAFEGWNALLWLANPDGFNDYARGTRATAPPTSQEG